MVNTGNVILQHSISLNGFPTQEIKRKGQYWHNSSVQLLSHVRLFATPWTAAHQVSLSITNSQSPPKPMSIESVIPSNHLILFCPLLLLSSLFLLTFHQGLVISYDCYEAVPGNLAHRNPDFISSRVYTV